MPQALVFRFQAGLATNRNPRNRRPATTPSPARPHQRAGDIDDVVAGSGQIFLT
ncbi:hypothetical protein HB774_34620 (plasmid) [Rhizobium leguminosarum bv. viciae]|nr:hypothetical protein HB774_34620 [Rhizobium leguminosarum bv. viciae]